jgi:hypothetical protein
MIRIRDGGWKEAFVTLVATGAIAWQILACTESPMSFSPTGDLAFTVMDPYADPDSSASQFALTGDHVNRLMVLTKDKRLREIERTSTQMLTAPAYSPDGKEFAYLRLPLLTQADIDRIDEFLKRRMAAVNAATTGSTAEKWILVAPKGSTPALPQNDKGDVLDNWTDLTFAPSAETPFLNVVAGGALTPVELVVRSASTGELIRSLSLRLPSGFDGPTDSYRGSYLLTRLQYSPDGRWIYFSLGALSMAVGPVPSPISRSTGEKRVLAAGSPLSLLSPDGKTLATLSNGGVLGFLSTAGDRAVSVLPQDWLCLGGVAWIGNKTVAVIGKSNNVIDIYDADGHLIRSSSLSQPELPAKSCDSLELAVSPDGRYMAISGGNVVQFLTIDGKLLGSWHGKDENERLVQPTFTRDSRQVAFKLMENAQIGGEKWLGTVAIAFFTPEGQEIFRAPIPPASLDQAP